jgi:hypothetical protein
MMKFILTRMLPVGAGVAIFGSALSPVGPTLNMFQAAANALAGDTEAEVDVAGLTPADRAREPSPHKTTPQGERRKKLEAIADQAGKSDEDAFGWKAGDRAPKPLAAPPPKKK